MGPLCREDDFLGINVSCLSHGIDPRPCRIDKNLRAKGMDLIRKNVPRRDDDAAVRFFYLLSADVAQDFCSGFARSDDVLNHKPFGHQDLMVVEQRAPRESVPAQAWLEFERFFTPRGEIMREVFLV